MVVATLLESGIELSEEALQVIIDKAIIIYAINFTSPIQYIFFKL